MTTSSLFRSLSDNKLFAGVTAALVAAVAGALLVGAGAISIPSRVFALETRANSVDAFVRDAPGKLADVAARVEKIEKDAGASSGRDLETAERLVRVEERLINLGKKVDELIQEIRVMNADGSRPASVKEARRPR